MYCTIVEDVWLLHFDLHPWREDSVDLVLSTAAIFSSVFLGQTWDDQSVCSLVREGYVWSLKPEEVGPGDTCCPAL